MWVSLLFLYAIVAMAIGVFLRFTSTAFTLPRLMRIAEFIALSGGVTLTLSLSG